MFHAYDGFGNRIKTKTSLLERRIFSVIKENVFASIYFPPKRIRSLCTQAERLCFVSSSLSLAEIGLPDFQV